MNALRSIRRAIRAIATWTAAVTGVAALTAAWGWLIWGAAVLSPTVTVIVLGVYIVVLITVCRAGKLDAPPVDEPLVDDRELQHFMSRDWDKPLRKEVP